MERRPPILICLAVMPAKAEIHLSGRETAEESPVKNGLAPVFRRSEHRAMLWRAPGTGRAKASPAIAGEVVAGGGEHGIDAVAVTALEMIAAHTVLGLHVADDRLDRGTTFHLAADRSGDAAYLAADPDAELLFVIMATISLVDMDAARGDPGLPLQFRNHRAERVAIERVAVQRFAVQHELAALGFGRGGGDRYLAAELIRRSSFAFANALHLGSMQRIDLRPALAMILEAHLHRQGEEIGKARLQCLVPGDLAANVADHPA